MSIINTNTISLNAQRNLSSNSASLATTIQRLSSGLRINSARDDAAGLAISERFSTQIRGLNVAVRNANDGISLAQTAEGALGEIGNNLQRIRELAVQSANATNSASDRAALNSEVSQLVSEIDRVAKQSDFNGTKLLDGSFTAQLFQVGANTSQAIAISEIANTQSSALGGRVFAATIEGAAIDGADFTPDVDDPSKVIIDAGTLTVNGVDLGEVSFSVGADDAGTAANALNAVVAAVNSKLSETGVLAERNAAGDGFNLVAVEANRDIEVAGLADFGVADADSVTIDLADDATFARQFASDLDITTVTGSQRALQIVDEALNAVNSSRADLGAVQNRFQSVVANLTTSSENLTASRSRIRDADYARETAELTRTQILQQAGTAMLAQANQIPQNVLSLLR
jgi:flagellin